LSRFFDLFGHERSSRERRSRLLDCKVLRERCSQALLCIDAYRVVTRVNEAIEQLRRALRNEARERGAKL
jgi:hypothetical protein